MTKSSLNKTSIISKEKTEHNNTGRRCARVIVLLFLTALFLCSCLPRQSKKLTLRQEGIDKMNAGDYAGAVNSLTMAASLISADKPSETDTDIRRYLAASQFMTGDYENAGITYNILENSNPGEPEYLDMQVICLAKQGKDPANAIDMYQTADKANHKSVSHDKALLLLGSAFVENEEYTSEILELYESSFADDKRKSAELYNRTGVIYYKAGDYDNALKYFSEGLAWIAGQNAKKEKSDNPESLQGTDFEKTLLYNEASCYEYLGNFEKALEIYQTYISKYGTDADVEHEISFLKTRVKQ